MTASFEPEPARTPKSLQTSRGSTKTVYLAGRLRFSLGPGEHELLAFAFTPEPEPGEPEQKRGAAGPAQVAVDEAPYDEA